MKKILSSAVILFVLMIVPLVIIPMSCNPSNQPIVPQVPEQPEPVKPEPVKPVEPSIKPITPIPSPTFMKGYWDGWHGVWLGPIRWTLSDDYRQGHMLGAYDRKHGIERYSPEQR